MGWWWNGTLQSNWPWVEMGVAVVFVGLDEQGSNRVAGGDLIFKTEGKVGNWG